MPYECNYTGKKTTFGNKKAYGGAKLSKGGFGLKDAPRMWRIRLGQILEQKLGLKPLQADRSIYCKWQEGRKLSDGQPTPSNLVLILTI